MTKFAKGLKRASFPHSLKYGVHMLLQQPTLDVNYCGHCGLLHQHAHVIAQVMVSS